MSETDDARLVVEEGCVSTTIGVVVVGGVFLLASPAEELSFRLERSLVTGEADREEPPLFLAPRRIILSASSSFSIPCRMGRMARPENTNSSSFHDLKVEPFQGLETLYKPL